MGPDPVTFEDGVVVFRPQIRLPSGPLAIELQQHMKTGSTHADNGALSDDADKLGPRWRLRPVDRHHHVQRRFLCRRHASDVVMVVFDAVADALAGSDIVAATLFVSTVPFGSLL